MPDQPWWEQVWNDSFPPINLWNYSLINQSEPLCPDCFHKTKLLGVQCVCKNKSLYPDLNPMSGIPPKENDIQYKVRSGGIKHDQDKVPLDLLDPLALEGLAAVLAFGAKKYTANNWRGGISYSRLAAALLRHMFAILRGEYVDKESGLPHIDHVGCCWMFLSNLMKTRSDLDDLWKPK